MSSDSIFDVFGINAAQLGFCLAARGADASIHVADVRPADGVGACYAYEGRRAIELGQGRPKTVSLRCRLQAVLLFVLRSRIGHRRERGHFELRLRFGPADEAAAVARRLNGEFR